MSSTKIHGNMHHSKSKESPAGMLTVATAVCCERCLIENHWLDFVAA